MVKNSYLIRTVQSRLKKRTLKCPCNTKVFATCINVYEFLEQMFLKVTFICHVSKLRPLR